MIIPVSKDMLSPVMNIYKECVTEMNERGLFNWNHEYPSLEEVENDIYHKHLFAFIKDDKPVGVVSLNKSEPEEYKTIQWNYPGPSLFVHRLAVKPGVRNLKIGQRLMEFSHEYAIQNNYRSIRLDVLQKNPQAMRLYKKCGYKKTGIIHFSYLDDPFQCMEISLKKSYQ